MRSYKDVRLVGDRVITYKIFKLFGFTIWKRVISNIGLRRLQEEAEALKEQSGR
jgi:hypothetical protein